MKENSLNILLSRPENYFILFSRRVMFNLKKKNVPQVRSAAGRLMLTRCLNNRSSVGIFLLLR